MITARKRLMTAAREFFERELCGAFRWDEVAHHMPEHAEKGPRGKRNPLGKYRERIAMSFGDFQLEVASSEDAPPLGQIRLLERDELRVEGPIDTVTWAQAGRAIKEQHRGR